MHSLKDIAEKISVGIPGMQWTGCWWCEKLMFRTGTYAWPEAVVEIANGLSLRDIIIARL
jgi:hypothetical protein